MKKTTAILLAAVLLAAAVCFAACVSEDMCEKINAALKKDYTTLAVEVSSTKDGLELNGAYNVRFNDDGAEIDYTFDRLNELGTGENPDSYKSVVTGKAQVKDGKIVGSEDLSFGQIRYTGFHFKPTFFVSVDATDNSFFADVVNPQGFVGNGAFDGTNMTVNVQLNGDALTRLTITYQLDGASVVVNYLFV